MAGATRAFISYAHDTAAHIDVVRRFQLFLRGVGVDARLDLSAASVPQDWAVWMSAQIRESDFILVIASPKYRERADGLAPDDEGRGVRWEARLIRDLYYANESAGRAKVLPVVLPNQSTVGIPSWLAPASCTQYTVTDWTVDGAQDLLRYLFNEPAYIDPPVQPRPALPVPVPPATTPPRPTRVRPKAVADAPYRAMVHYLAVDGGLRGRDHELAEMASFLAGDEPYLWWTSPANSGKTALLAGFTLDPPPGVDVVSFFIRDHAEHGEFSRRIVEQLVGYCRERAPSGLAGADLDAARQRLFDTAPRLASESGRQLVLLVDGLDHDLDDEASIASLLPAGGLKVVVSSRPGYRLPVDVPASHPLHDCGRRELAPNAPVPRAPDRVQATPPPSAPPAAGPRPLRIAALGLLVFGGALLLFVVGFVVTH
jgi:SEFIR domain